jgi:UDP-glucose 4-epimerase
VGAVLVIGGSSFVGRHLLPRLAASGAEVHATARGTQAAPASDGVRWLTTDLTAPDPAAAWPARCDAVVYLAQSRAWRQFPEGAADVFAVNVHGALHAAEYARRAGATRFILASTGSVYPPGTTPARERDPIDLNGPRHFYVAAKLSAELLLDAYAALMKVIVLRLFVPYGPGQAAEMLMPRLIHKVRQGEPILLDGDDGLLLNPVAIGDVVEAIERCLRLDASATLNIAGPEILSLREIGEQIGRVTGTTPRFERRSGDARSIVGDTSALAAALGWAPSTSLADGLRGWAGK